MTKALNSLLTTHDEGTYVAEINVDIPLINPDGLARCNVFRPKDTNDGARYPVLMTMGPCELSYTLDNAADPRRQGHSL